MITDEVLFYGGLLLAVAAAVALVICLVVCAARRKKLDAQMDTEYGPEQTKQHI